MRVWVGVLERREFGCGFECKSGAHNGHPSITSKSTGANRNGTVEERVCPHVSIDSSVDASRATCAGAGASAGAGVSAAVAGHSLCLSILRYQSSLFLLHGLFRLGWAGISTMRGRFECSF